MEEYVDIVTLKKRWEKTKAELVEIVLNKIIWPYEKRVDGTYHRVKPLTRYTTTEWRNNWVTGRPYPHLVERYREPTKEDIAEGLERFVWFRKIDIDDAEYEGKIKLPERHQEKAKTTGLSQSEEKNGPRSRKNPAFILALQKYLEENPKARDKYNTEIARDFANKHKGDSRVCKIKVNGNPWEVYCVGNYLYARADERYDGKKAKQKERKINLDTFRRYIPEVRESISQQKSISYKKI